MGVPILTPPLVGHDPALADDVMALLELIVAEMNGNIDADNLADGAITGAKIADGTITAAKINANAAIPFSKLEHDLDNGQVLMGFGGIPVPATLSGLATISTLGELQPEYTFKEQQLTTNLDDDGTTYTTIDSCEATNIRAGKYLMVATIGFIEGTTTLQYAVLGKITGSVDGDLVSNGLDLDGSQHIKGFGLSLITVTELTATQTISLKAVTLQGSGGTPTTLGSSMMLWRLRG